ncbi:hypothetical protein IL992_35905 [Microbispora sp. NEAU-D428]|uniref:hypothetical protein n=1 Tax=Microbispora sitophila TaxID=2771537 RepID=UPI001868154B|nr:hypothetical protein [Microbispora sitophila]MBE3014521.1 hypothetical protein [Microbispora sitophila]
MSPLSVVPPPPGVFLLFGQVADLGWVAVKPLLLYATAVAVIFEPKGAVSVVTRDRPVGDVTQHGLRHAPRP